MSGNLKFFEQIKTLLGDVEGLLVKLIKESSLNAQAKQKKENILQQIKEIRADYPQLEISNEEPYQDCPLGEDGVPLVAVADIKYPVFNGYLEKRRKEKKLLGRATQKRYCVLENGRFFYFEKESDKKQHGHIILQGYQARPVTDAKNEFEIYAEGKRNYQFVASNAGSMTEWISKINECAGVTPKPSESGDDNHQETYDEVEPPDDVAAEDDNLYEDYMDESFSPNQPQPTQPAQDDELYEDTAVPETIEPEIYDDTVDTSMPPPPPLDEIYDDTVNEDDLPPPPQSEPNTSALHSGSIAQELSMKLAAKSLPKPPPEPGNKSALHGQLSQSLAAKPLPKPPGSDDDSKSPSPVSTFRGNNPVPVVPSRDKPSPPSSKRPPLPSAPKTTSKAPPAPPMPSTPVPPKPSGTPDVDYDKLYRGLWDCTADESNELEFKRGDLIEILSKKYDTYAWWVGRLNEKIGLVPKDYITKAYEKIL